MIATGNIADYLTVEEAATRLQISGQALRRAIREGKLPVYEAFGARVLRCEDVARYRPNGRADIRPSRAGGLVAAA